MAAALFAAAIALVAPGHAAAERVLYASATGKGGYFAGRFIAAPRLEEVLAGLGGPLAEKTVVQLLTDDAAGTAITVYRSDRDACQFAIVGVEGTAAAPLILRGQRHGARPVTEIAGDSVEAIIAGRFGCERTAVAALRTQLVEPPALPAKRTATRRLTETGMAATGMAATGMADAGDPAGRMLGAGAQSNLIRCFRVAGSRHVAVEDIAFKDCWLTAIYIVGSAQVRVSGAFIQGSSYAVFAAPGPGGPAAARGFVIERNVWIQDNSGYGPDRAAACRAPGAPGASLDCPGDVWTRVPWGVTHDTLYEHMNGALFGSADIGGDVAIRNNAIANAYNGIRMIVSERCAADRACVLAANRDVAIVDNDFLYIRDNPVEPETRAVNWTIARNRIRNAHAWFSFDNVAGGPIFVWGNVGWNDDVPGRRCVDGEEWKRHARVDFVLGGYRPVEEVEESLSCTASWFGAIIKEGSRGEALEKDIYVFNNSWYLRGAVLRKAQVGRIKYWNNALHSTACGAAGAPDCRILVTAPGEDECDGRRDYLTDDARMLLFKCVDPVQAADPLRYDFRYNLSSAGFPAAFLAAAGRRGVHFAGDPLFRLPAQGDLRLRAASPAIGRGCIVEWTDRTRTALRCREPAAREARPDIGAYSKQGALYRGPQ